MAQGDWTDMTGTLTSPAIRRGVISAITPPNGGGSFTYGVNSVTTVTGVAAIYVDLAGVNPTLKGGVFSAALRRGLAGESTGTSPFIWAQGQGTSVSDTGYLLGLSDAEPSRLILRKGRIDGGIPDLTPDPVANGNLLASSETFASGTWVHTRLDVIVQGNGDVLLKVWYSDLDSEPVTAPVWTVPPGMAGTGPVTGFIDDSLQIQTGTAPLLAGYVGFGVTVSGLGRRGFVDHFDPTYQS